MSKKHQIKTIKKLERWNDGYVGFITSQELLVLNELGLILTRNHKDRIKVALFEQQIGLCDRRWLYFLIPKKNVVEYINKWIDIVD